MPHITSFQVISGHRLTLQFDDGTHGAINLSADLTGPIFEELQDSETFKQAYLDPELRTVCWPNGADFAPEFLRSLASEKQVLVNSNLEQLVQETPSRDLRAMMR